MATVLLLEDQADSAEVMRFILQRGGHTVVHAADGQEGLALLKTVQPQVVLLDVMMPESDGYWFLKRLRQDERWRGLRVIVLSGVAFTDPAPLKALGVEEVLLKGSLDYKRLLELVDTPPAGAMADAADVDAQPQHMLH